MDKVIVVGGGAAGIMAAISAAESGDSVLLIEKNLEKKFISPAREDVI